MTRSTLTGNLKQGVFAEESDMDIVIFNNPGKLVFGAGCFREFLMDMSARGLKRIFVIGIPEMESMLQIWFKPLMDKGIEIAVFTGIEKEPSFGDLKLVLAKARDFRADGIAGIGGGSVLDTAKLLSVMLSGKQSIKEVKGIDRIKERTTFLACIPTTSGTGSEVSPNAIFHDEESGNKEGVISPYLVPDAIYIDPELTASLPPRETAATGMDALIHCIEAYGNRFAHPVVDRIALEGIRLIGKSLKKAYTNGQDISARSEMSLGSMYGGMCLGPVNTAAVHALAYPLGSIFRVSHGIANALLLPHVLRFNIEAAPERYSVIAIALGAEKMDNQVDTALDGIRIIEDTMRDCGLPVRLSELNITEKDLDKLTESAMKVTRLLKNNPRDLTSKDAKGIYTEAL